MLSAIQSILFHATNWGARDDDTDSSTDTMDTESTSDFEYEPSVLDVIVAKAMISKGLKLPNEIVDTIVDLAEYWPHTATETPNPPESEEWWRVIRNSPEAENILLLRAPPLGFPPAPMDTRVEYSTTPIPPAPLKGEFTTQEIQKYINSPIPIVERPCRKIVFITESRDQGWGGNAPPGSGPYTGSWTWFSTGMERLESGKITDKPSDENDDPNDAEDITDQIAMSPTSRHAVNLKQVRSVWPGVQLKSEPDRTEPSTGAQQESKEKYEYVHALHPDPHTQIQANLRVNREVVRHRVVWRYTDDINPESEEAVNKLENRGRGKATGNGEFLRTLKIGDIVTVWGHSRFPGWANHVKKVEMKVYYAI